jgi:hypothetical protein
MKKKENKKQEKQELLNEDKDEDTLHKAFFPILVWPEQARYDT